MGVWLRNPISGKSLKRCRGSDWVVGGRGGSCDGWCGGSSFRVNFHVFSV